MGGIYVGSETTEDSNATTNNMNTSTRASTSSVWKNTKEGVVSNTGKVDVTMSLPLTSATQLAEMARYISDWA